MMSPTETIGRTPYAPDGRAIAFECRRCIAALALLAGLALIPPRALASGTIGLNFTGVTLADNRNLGTSEAPPDTMGAVGPTQIAQFVNGCFAVYDKSTGNLIGSKISDKQFWINAGLGSAGLTDPRILFDTRSNRWFAIQATTDQTTNNIIRIARSNTASASGAWAATSISVSTGAFADYPTLGLDADGLYIGTNDFSSGGSFQSVSLYSIPKADLLLSTPSLSRLTSFAGQAANTYGFTLQPAVSYGPSVGQEAILARDNLNSARLDRTSVLGATGANATLSSRTRISISSTSTPPQAHQPDGTQQIDTVDSRITGNVQHVGNLLYLARAISFSGRDAIRWTILNETTNAVVQEGTISDPNYDYFQPSIAANAYGDVLLAYNRSGTGASDFISSYASVGTTAGSTVTFGTPTLLKAGVTNYHLFGGSGERWGDYSATMTDPSNPRVFWTLQEFPAASDTWATQITQITVPGAVNITWTGLNGNAWDVNTTANWSASGPAVFFSNGAAVSFDDTGTNTNPITLPAQVHPAAVIFNNATTTYTLSGAGGIADSTAPTTLTKNGSGAVTLSVPISYTGGTTLNAGTLNINGPQSYASATMLLVAGGTLNMSTDAGSSAVAHLAVTLTGGSSRFSSSQHLAALTLNGTSTAAITSGTDKVLATGTLSIAGTASLDLARNGLLVHTGSVATITPWLGGQITTSVPDSSLNHSWAILLGSQISANGNTSGFHGEPIAQITGSDILIQYGWTGDLNMDGTVNYLDYGVIDNAYLGHLAATPAHGNLNGDNVINYLDYGLMDNAFLAENAPAAALAAASVPEPPVAAVLALGGVCLLRRNRRVLSPSPGTPGEGRGGGRVRSTSFSLLFPRAA